MKHSTNKVAIVFFATMFTCNSTIAMNQCRSQQLIQRSERQIQKANVAAEEAIRHDCPNDLRTALDNGASPDYTDKRGNNFLLMTRKGKAVAQELLQHDIFQRPEHINHQNHWGQTALMNTCCLGEILTAQTLIGLPGINLNLQDTTKHTAAHYAALSKSIRGRSKIIQELAYKADFTIPNNKGITPVIFLAINNEVIHLGALREIMKRKGLDGNTQAHLLATARIDKLELQYPHKIYLRIIKMLNLVGLNILTPNHMNQLPVDIAIENLEYLKHLYHTTPSDDLYKAVTNQEKILHNFIRFSLQASQIPIQTTSPFFLMLNVETIIALEDSLKDPYYYERNIEHRNAIKQELHNRIQKNFLSNPNGPFVWIPADNS